MVRGSRTLSTLKIPSLRTLNSNFEGDSARFRHKLDGRLKKDD